MAKRKTDSVTATEVPTRCDQGGDELVPVVIETSQGDAIDWTMLVCKANADVRLMRRTLPSTQEDLLLHQQGTDELAVVLGPLPVGRHLFRWLALAPAGDWQTLTEIVVNETTVFRLRRTSSGTNPLSATGFVIVGVS